MLPYLYLKCFDVVQYILLNYKEQRPSQLAKNLNIKEKTIIGILNELGLEVKVKQIVRPSSSAVNIKKLEEHNPALADQVRKKVVSISKTETIEGEPNRVVIERPPATYSNTSPYGIASDLHQQKGDHDF